MRAATADQRARRRVRTRVAMVATFAALTALLVADWALHYKLWPTPTPFPATYGNGDGASVEFHADGTAAGVNLPVWGGVNCTQDPDLVSGEGHWHQGRDGRMWLRIDDELVRWGPDVELFRSLNWEKIVLLHCEDNGVATTTVLNGTYTAD